MAVNGNYSFKFSDSRSRLNIKFFVWFVSVPSFIDVLLTKKLELNSFFEKLKWSLYCVVTAALL